MWSFLCITFLAAGASCKRSRPGLQQYHLWRGGWRGLLLDVFEPANNNGQPRPAVVLVHGGGWTSFDKSTMRPLAQFLALAGFVAVPVDYRLVHDDATRWSARLDNVRRAVRWLRANSAKYNVDPNHIGAYGHSAGGQIAALLGMLETRHNSDPTLSKYSSKLQAVVDASGPADFTTHDDDDANFLTNFLGADFAKHPEVWRDASPIFHVSKTLPSALLADCTSCEGAAMVKILPSPGRISSKHWGVEGGRSLVLDEWLELRIKSCVFRTFSHDQNSTRA